MRQEQRKVIEFMDTAFKNGGKLQEAPRVLTMPPLEVRRLRVKLIAEELIELADSFGLSISLSNIGGAFGHEPSIYCEQNSFGCTDFREAIDAVADLKYVVEGAGCAMGVDTAPIFDEVHESNMSKFIDGYCKPDGKWQKGPSYRKPDFDKAYVLEDIGTAEREEEIARNVKHETTRDLNEKLTPADPTKVFKMVVLFLCLFASSLFAQQPPPVWYTNVFHLEVRYATDGVHYTNSIGSSDYENESTNAPWANGFNHIPLNAIFYNWTGYPTNEVVCYWTWNLNRFDTNNFNYNGVEYNMATNWLQVTNDPDDTGGTILEFSPYPPPQDTNALVHYLSFHTDGNTLSFQHNFPNGSWSWSGARDYRQPYYYLSDRGQVQGVSTDGSVNPVHLWCTNEVWKNGHLISSELVK
jgi:predicted HAD superfamily Cof-like phosphohydrolase